MGTLAGHKPKIEVVSDSENLARRSLDLFVAEAEKTIKTKDKFFVAISGGFTPKRFFELIGQASETKALPWEKIHLFWVDERYVPIDSPSSNYKLAADTFLTKVDIPEDNIHRIPTELDDSKLAARYYEKMIQEIFSLRKGQVPKFDFIILGMGADGHIGSLFPESYAHFDTTDLACVVYVMDDKLNRITLTYPVLRAASQLVVLVSGEEKAGILKKVLTSEPDEVRFPVHLLWPVLEKVTWLVDKQAAKLL